MAELTGHVGIIYSLQVLEGPTPGGTRLFSACYDKTLRVSLADCFILIVLAKVYNQLK